jgi:hypothetical protein
LATHPDQYPTGKDQQGNPVKNEGCGQLPGWTISIDACRGQAQVYCQLKIERLEVSEYGFAERTGQQGGRGVKLSTG